jgi:curved DNA-binding protein CbpA
MSAVETNESPYATLGLRPGAGADEVRAAYQKLVRRYPPEMAPREFARVHRAYQLLRSPARRLEEAKSAPAEAVEQLGGVSDLVLAPPPPPPAPLTPAALEPLLAPHRRARLAEVLARYLG